MRFLLKRPKVEDVREEINMLMEVMSSNFFVVFDLLWFSVIFTMLLAPAFHSVKLAAISFFISFVIFNGLYFCIVERFFRNRLL